MAKKDKRRRTGPDRSPRRPVAGRQPKPKDELPSYLAGGKVPLTDIKPVKGGGFLGNRPETPENISAPAVAAGAQTAGSGFTAAQLEALAPAFRQLADQQYSQVQRFAGDLNNQYTQDARNAVMGSLGDANQMGVLGQSMADQSRAGFATSGPTEIEQELYRQGQAELGLGRALSPEQMREATQSARQGFAARGMATGMGAVGAELLNRDRFATQREAQRRQFAAVANQTREDNVMARRDAAGRLGALSGDMLANAGRTRQLGAGLLGELDPFARAMNPGLTLGSAAQSYGLNTIGQGFGNMLDLYANTGSFNVNRGDSLLNTWLNNNTAIRTGNQAAAATTNAANITAAAARDAANANKPTTMDYIIGGATKLFGG